jgi:L-alanine-DL-glutamate epimerase-like enolase superfamily enzyme
MAVPRIPARHAPVQPPLNVRLKPLGIDARAARNATLLDLAAQLPAAVLSCLLGLGVTTATAWTHHAGHRTGYAAELVLRQMS